MNIHSPVTDAARSAQARSEESVTLFTIKVDDEEFGIPIDLTRTVFNATRITAVPLAPPRVLGLINVRGSIVPAISLRKCLGLPEQESKGSLLTVSFEYRDEEIGLIVDEVCDVVQVREADKLPPPSNLSRQRARYTTALYRCGDRLIPYLDLPALMDDDTMANCTPRVA